MLFNPMLRVSALIIKIVVRRANIPSIFQGLAVNFFTVSRSLISNFGFFPTLAAVRYIQTNILRGTAYSKLPVSNIPDFILKPLLSLVQPSWAECLVNVDKFSRYFWLMKFGLFFTTFHRLIFMVSRLFIGSVAASVGILFSPPGLSYLIDFLRPLATSVVLFVEAHSPFRIIPLLPNIKKDIATATSWTLLGFFIGGVVSISAGLGFAHYLFPAMFVKVPVVGTVIGGYAAYVNEIAGSLWNLFVSYLPFQGSTPDSDSNQGWDPAARVAAVDTSFQGKSPVQHQSDNSSGNIQNSVLSQMRMPEHIQAQASPSRNDELRQILTTFGRR